jgi:RNA recognition motif-containing protein
MSTSVAAIPVPVSAVAATDTKCVTSASKLPPSKSKKDSLSKLQATTETATSSSSLSQSAIISSGPVLFRSATGSLEKTGSVQLQQKDGPMAASSVDKAEGVSLLINNLPVGTKAVDVRSLLSTYGKVINCKVGVMKSQKDVGGLFALVVMERPSEATMCINRLHQSTFGGHTISVMMMKPS